MTGVEVLLALVVCLMVFRGSFWKGPPKGPKKGKPIPARSGRLKRKAVAFRYQPPSPEDVLYANQKRAEQIAASMHSEPSIALREALKRLGVRYEQEVITWFDGNRFVLSDFVLPDYLITIEQDGFQHKFEKIRDEDKAKIIFDARRYTTIRHWNSWFLTTDLDAKLRALLKIQL